MTDRPRERDPNKGRALRKGGGSRRLRPLRAALVAAASIFLLAAVGLVLLRLGAFDRLVLAEASRRLEAAAGLKLEAKSIEIDPFRLSVKLKGPAVRAVPGSGPVLREFTAEEADLDVPWSLLLGGGLRLQKVRIVRPAAVFSTAPEPRRPGGEPPAPPRAASKPASFGLRIDDLVVTEGKAGWAGAPGSFGISLQGIDLEVRYETARRSHSFALVASRGRLEYSDKAVEISRLVLRGGLGPGEIVVETFDVATLSSSISLAGTVRNLSASPEFEGRARISLSVGEIPLPSRPALGAEGLITAEASISRKSGGIAYEAEVSTSGLAIRELGRVSLDIKVRGDEKSVTASRLDLRTEAGEIGGSFSVDLKSKTVSEVELNWKDLDPDRILPSLPFPPPLPVSWGSLASGRLSGRARALSLDGFDGTLVLALVPAQPPRPSRGPGRPPLLPSAQIALRASRDGIKLDSAGLTAAGVSVTASGILGRDGRLDGEYSLEVPSLPATVAALRSLGFGLPRSKSFTFDLDEISGSASVAGAFSGRAGAPSVTARLVIPEIGLGLVRAGPLNADLRATAERIDIRSFEGTVSGGSFRASGAIALGRTRRSGSPAHPLSSAGNLSVERSVLECENIDLAPFASLLPESWPKGLAGLLSARAEIVSGPGGISAAFSVDAKGLAAAAVSLPQLRLEGTYASSRLDLTEFLAVADTGRLSGKGDVDLRNGTFSAALHSDGFELETVRPLFSPGFGLAGRAVVDLDAQGDLKAPRGTLALSIAGFRAGRFASPVVTLEARSDGASARASLRLPDYNAALDAELALSAPFTINGKIAVADLPLRRFIGATSPPGAVVRERATALAESRLDLGAVFTYPLTDPSGFTADLSFSGKDLSVGPREDASGAGAGPTLTASFAGRVLASGDPGSSESLKADGEISRFVAAFGEKSVSNSAPIRFHLAGGHLRIDSLSLEGTGGSLSVSGTAGPFPGRLAIEGSLRADLNAAILSPLVNGMAIGGRLRAEIEVRGEPSGSSITGRAVVSDGFVRPGDFPLILNGIVAEVSLDGSRLEITRLEATANGGPLRVRGAIDGLLGAAPPSGRIALEAQNLQLEYPPGLRTTSDVALALSGQGGQWTLSGSMKILRGLFREDISPGGSILGFGSYRWAQGEGEMPAFIRGIDLDIAVSAAEPIVFRNNLADLGVLADVRVSGNPGLPLFSGRLYNDAVGTITFGERRFVLETARLDLLGQRVPDPNIEIVAHTSITHNQEPLDIRLRLYGPASDLRYSLTSVPPRSKEDLSLIILTGQSLDEVRGNAVNTLTTQTLKFFASPIASPVTSTLERLLKAEDVSFTPLLISAEADPGARFTFRKKISEDVEIVYSLDITSTQDQTLLLDYRLRRNFSLQAFRKDNGSYGGSLRHSVPIRLRSSAAEGSARERKAAPSVLSTLITVGEPKLPPEVVGSALRRLKEGKPFSYSRLNNAVDKLLRTYGKRGFANADVKPTVATSEDGRLTAVRLAFSPGLPVRLVYGGDGVSSRVRRAIRKNWTGLLPEEINLGDAQSLILKKLHRKGYYEARVESEKRALENESRYEITVVKGPRYETRHLSVEGNEALTTDAVLKAVSKYPLAPYRGLWNLVYDPRAALDAVASAYRAIGYTDARVRRRQVVSDPGARTVDVGLAVEEGPLRVVRAVGFAGQTALSEPELRRVIQTAAGKPYDPSLPLKDKDALLAFCRSRGFLKAEIRAEVTPRPGGPDVDVVFQITEGPVHTVSGLEVRGSGRTRDSLILKTAKIKTGDVFSFESLAAGQKRLYDLGVFRTVDISAPDSAQESTSVPVVLDVREETPLTFTYGLRYSSEEQLEGQVGLSLVNLLGRGRTALASYRLSGRLWDARFSVNLPYAFGYRADTRLSFSTSRESREAYVSDEIAGSVGQEIKLKKGFELNVLYKLSRVRERTPEETSFGPSVVLSELFANSIRDTRDDRFDARTGSFLSLSLTGAPKLFGAAQPYIKVFSQYSFYRKAWGKVRWASNVRFGAMAAIGQDVPASRLFYAGGGTSLRGFRQDMVGPMDPATGLPAGGTFVLLLNQELRLSLFSFLSGVVFYDVGNVYASLGDLARFDLRQGIGAGIRAASPIGLLRFDCGLNPFRRTGEPSIVLFLSIGQAF